MDGLWIILVALSGVVSSSHGWISLPTLEVTVRPGDNITLYCDCRRPSGASTLWFRNCSHENQPTLVLDSTDQKLWTPADKLVCPCFEFVKNFSTDSYDLLIRSITDSDEGLYYCGIKKAIVEDREYITTRHVYRYGNITTRLIVASVVNKTPVNLKETSTTPWKTAVCAGSCSSLCVRLLPFSPPCSFYSSVGKQPNVFKLMREKLTPEARYHPFRMKMSFMLRWNSIRQHRDQRG
ncbi:uncharacterized protein LOC125004572 isoform X4 [Mugil cephalus]|uniref:uncharacterized protein LOC125004572 isoform X4 n=1 Tax=Mugil cephalus TaxID=48193 RepID=UPI001FB68C67|nr:uncharacterized protein LOC125004572 isoform X4 [Mugil cephalus]